MISHSAKNGAMALTKFFRHDRKFYQHAVPEIFPLFSYDSVRTEALQSWRADLRHQQGLSVPPPPAMLEPEFEAGGISKQRLLEKQRLELVLCENPGFMLHYAQRLDDQLGINHGIVKDYAVSRHSHHFLNCIIVSADFYYTWLGRTPNQWFYGSQDWWQLQEMIRAFDLEIPQEHHNPIPRTGLLYGELFWEAVANLHSGRVFYPMDQLDNPGSGAAAASSGGSAGSGAGGANQQNLGTYLGGSSAASAPKALAPLSATQMATLKKAALAGVPFVEVCG